MKHQKVGIIGGGIAGLYAAWRMVNADRGCEVHLFESAEDVGGRIRSVFLPKMPFPAELGAMRFRSNHLLLKALLDEFRIPARPFDVRPPRIRVRGRSLSSTELKEGTCRHCGAGVPYLLRASERGMTAEELVLSAIRRLLRDLSFPGLSQGAAQRAKQKILDEEISSSVWTLIKQHGWYENTPLYKIGFWNLLQHYLSGEAFQLVHAALSLESVLGNWSAAEAIPWFMADFTATELMMVPDGMEEVIRRLKAALCDSKDESTVSSRVVLRTGCSVRGCQRNAGEWTVFLAGEEKPEAFKFDALVLALPKAALERIEVRDDGWLEAWKPEWLTHVQPHVLYKLFLLYEREWWMGDDAPGYSVGRTFTDLPVRQVYYFSPNWMKQCAKVADNKRLHQYADADGPTATWSLVMASYSDEHYVDFWRPFSLDEDGAPYYRPPTNMNAEEERNFRQEVELIPTAIRANERIVRKVQQQLIELHGHIVPDPIMGLYKDWGLEPFGAGWHTWNIGTKPWEHLPFGAAKGGWPENVYVVGEAFSAEQGWIEGALKTVERVLLQMEVPSMVYEKGWPPTDLRGYVGAVPINERTVPEEG